MSEAGKMTRAQRAFLTELNVQRRAWNSLVNAKYRTAVDLKNAGLAKTTFSSPLGRDYLEITALGRAALKSQEK